MTVASLRDHTGTYGAGFALLIALAAAGATAVLALPKAAQAGSEIRSSERGVRN